MGRLSRSLSPIQPGNGPYPLAKVNGRHDQSSHPVERRVSQRLGMSVHRLPFPRIREGVEVEPARAEEP
jgi:hypothetical protein